MPPKDIERTGNSTESDQSSLKLFAQTDLCRLHVLVAVGVRSQAHLGHNILETEQINRKSTHLLLFSGVGPTGFGFLIPSVPWPNASMR